ncbi:hypothetical protein MMC09_004891 [Bachmanniomyces sp. S44760]|nr:hypothetical protein [Bachmanniomyces sp. S44760]
MAFHAPTAAPYRHSQAAVVDLIDTRHSPVAQQRDFDDNQEWVLFSPAQDSFTNRTPTTFTGRTPRTAGLSGLSDFGSLNTLARSGNNGYIGSDLAANAIEDDEDLDSLDDGLHEFGESSVYQRTSGVQEGGTSVLPAHDGLGTFAPSSSLVQEHLSHFEQHNPYRRYSRQARRRSSVQRRPLSTEEQNSSSLDKQRMERIEEWRIEQSKVVLDAIQWETQQIVLSGKSQQDTERRISTYPHSKKTSEADVNSANVERGEPTSEEVDGKESSWQSLTRRVIRDLIGIDDSLLSVIFGESLAAEVVSPPGPIENTVPPRRVDASAQATASIKTWQHRLLERLARELGFIVHQLTEHSGKFSPYKQSLTMDYAGIPVTEDSIPQPSPSITLQPTDSITARTSTHFKPTLQDRAKPSSAAEHAALWGIEEEKDADLDVQYWEDTPDIKNILQYLQKRFASSYSNNNQRSHPTSPRPPGNVATSNSPDALRRAAIIRQHHPLVSRAKLQGSQGSMSQRHGINGSGNWPIGLGSAIGSSLKRHGSSCASASMKRSRRGDGTTGDSRNYWDIGGSVGSGSMITGEMMGAWGEV